MSGPTPALPAGSTSSLPSIEDIVIALVKGDVTVLHAIHYLRQHMQIAEQRGRAAGWH